MNIQKPPNGIEWTRIRRQESGTTTTLIGATWNPTAGCFHNCMWAMPDGTVAECYAKTVAENLAAKSYPYGFAFHYWHPERLHEPLKARTPMGIFVGSMADLFGHWVHKNQIRKVINVMRRAHWHTFLILTKNPRRLMEFSPFPPNVWVGASITGGPLTRSENAAQGLSVYLRYLDSVKATVRFISFEPLWFDAASTLWNWRTAKPLPIEWAIIGAASNGAKTYQPESEWVSGLVSMLRTDNLPIFMKGNLNWSPHIEEFPDE